MEWLGCMDMLSGGNFADGSCAILSQSLWLSAAAVAALIFCISGFPVLSGNCRRYCVQLFPHPSATGNHTPAYARANRHIHGISLSSFIANLFAIPLVTLSRFR